MLLAAKIPLGRLDGDVPQQELDLVQFASGFAAQAGAGPSEVMWGKPINGRFLGAVLHDVPYAPLRYACSPRLARPANTPEHAPVANAGGLAPGVNCRLDPVGNRYCANVSAFTDEVDDGPVILPPLNMREFQLCSLSTAKPAAQQNPKQGSIPFAL